MSENPQVNELVQTAAESIVRALAGAFDVIFARPDAPELVAAFLGGTVSFRVCRDGVEILGELPDDDAPRVLHRDV